MGAAAVVVVEELRLSGTNWVLVLGIVQADPCMMPLLRFDLLRYPSTVFPKNRDSF